MKALVLLSGGLDSSVNLYQALNLDYEIVKVLSFDYGQKAAQKEIQASKKICEKLNLSHEVLKLDWLKKISTSSLTNNENIPNAKTLDIASYEVSKKSASLVWVPNRNGVFLNIAASYAESLKADILIPGFNLEEARTFPDNSKAFVESLNKTFEYSTKNKVKLECFTIAMNKSEILALAQNLDIDLKSLWPCYNGDKKWCGDCESCLRFKRACETQNVNYLKLRG